MEQKPKLLKAITIEWDPNPKNEQVTHYNVYYGRASGDYTNEIQKGILWFVGFKVRISRMGPTDHNPPEWLKNSWKRKVMKLGKLGE